MPAHAIPGSATSVPTIARRTSSASPPPAASSPIDSTSVGLTPSPVEIVSLESADELPCCVGDRKRSALREVDEHDGELGDDHQRVGGQAVRGALVGQARASDPL